MAKVTLTITDAPGGGVHFEWTDLPCPVHDKPAEQMTPAEKWAADVARSIHRACLVLGEPHTHDMGACHANRH